MSEIYRTKAELVWVSLLDYDEEKKRYCFHIDYVYGNWKVVNRVILFFNEKGEFLEATPFIYENFKNQTLEETAKDHMLYAENYKKIAKKMIQILIKPVEKKNIIFDEKETYANDELVKITFKVEEMKCEYYLDLTEYEEFLNCELKESEDRCSVTIRNIPSLKGIDTYIQNHPEIRVKYVNELARYKQNKKYEV